MDLNLSPEETRFRDELRAWLETHTPNDWEHRRDASIEQHFDDLQRSRFVRCRKKLFYPSLKETTRLP